MKTTLTRRAALGGIASALATAALAEPPLRSLRPVARPGAPVPVVRDAIADVVARAGLGGVVGVAVADLETGAAFDLHNSARPLPPASVGKSLTAQYALEHLGADHRFITRIIADGPISDGILDGNLILVGGGDPTLLTDHLADAAARTKAAGLREVRGRFLVWNGALPYQPLIDPDQMEHLGYNPALSGLNLNFNRVHFEWARNGGDYRVTMDARSEKYRPDVHMARMEVRNRDLPVYTYEDGGTEDRWTVARGALGNGGARWLPVRHPELYAGDVFRTFARSHGITLSAPERATDIPVGTVLATLTSGPLTEIAQDMLKYSVNLTAEVLGLTTTQSRTGMARTIRSSAAEMNRWLLSDKGVAARMVDHSGLGDDSRITASGMVRFLSRPEVAGRLRPLLKDIPIRDADNRAIPNHPVQIVAKTGTLNFVSTLAGYIRTEGGGDRAFAIFAADLDRREAAKRSGDEVPAGVRTWNRKARDLQQALLLRWGTV
ncbi:D-alanyl-D-alanine carboxypeptidase/D-alanyl-D-alanine endopeptidase [Marivivens marinus]|uniref:D-alanyl-D-alanine carboxypeptidase/D-alanyl-D-alanine endopeptidase n=1 Tax=Marivivens marinus TaxID=3110173 RepID=UPI003B84ADDF